MSGEIAVRRTVDLTPERLSNDQVKAIASTDFVPKAYRGNLAAIAACIYTGRELGLGDLEALRSIDVIDGRPSLSAELMVKLVRARGHSITGIAGPEGARVTGRRHDNGDEMTVEWNVAMARQAGLLEKANWKKYPAAMLWARAASQLCRMLFPDALRGLSYTADEVELTEEERVSEALPTAVPTADSDGPIDVVAHMHVDEGTGAFVKDSPGEGAESQGAAAAGEPVEEPPGAGAPIPEAPEVVEGEVVDEPGEAEGGGPAVSGSETGDAARDRREPGSSTTGQGAFDFAAEADKAQRGRAARGTK